MDHAAIARACGCSCVQVSEADRFLSTLAELLHKRGAAVIDVMVDPDAYPPITSFGEGPIQAARKMPGSSAG